MRTLAVALGLLGILAFGGCAVSRLMNQGDAHLLANRPGEAARCYEAALAGDPRLAENSRFVGRLKRARALAAYEDGERWVKEGMWDEAIRRFNDSLRQEPFSDNAKRALGHAKGEASKVHHKKALQHADQGKLNQAILELKKALELDPGNLDAKDALDSVQETKGKNVSRARTLYERAWKFAGEKRWGQGSSTVEVALAANPNHILCRVVLCSARGAIAKAEGICSDGEALLAAKRLELAKETLERSLKVWPYYPRGLTLLKEARTRRELAAGLCREAVALGKNNRWDEAVRNVAASLRIFPFDVEARTLLRGATNGAATAHCERGRTLLTSGKLVEAEKEFVRSLGFVPNMTQARDGLAMADFTRGEQAAQKQQWGNALLWYMQAADHLPSAQYAGKVRLAQSKVFERVRFSLKVEIRDLAGAPPAIAASLKSGISGRVAQTKPDVLQVIGEADKGAPSYRALVQLNALDVRGGLIKTENRIYRYTVYRMVPNPEIPRLEGLLRVAGWELARLRREYNRACPRCAGTARVTCTRCRGTGSVTCARCNGRGGQSLKGVWQRCRACGGTGTSGCRACGGGFARGSGTVVCNRCGGTGRGNFVTLWEVQRAETEVARLDQSLRGEPAMVRQGFPAEWPYVVRHYEKRGAADVSVQIRDVATNALVCSETIRKTALYGDKATENANPAIGLAVDGLDLPSDQSIRRLLIDASAAETARKLLSGVLTARGQALKAAADSLAGGGKRLKAIEATVDYARVVEGSDPSLAARVLRGLKSALRTHAVPGQCAPELLEPAPGSPLLEVQVK